MFNRKLKKNKISPENIEGDQGGQCSSFCGRVAIAEAPAVKAPVENHKGKTDWLNRLFGHLLQNNRSPSKSVTQPCSQTQRVASSEGPPIPRPENQQTKKKKKKTFWRLFSCCRKKHSAAPVTEDEAQQKTPRKTDRSCSPTKTQDGTQQPNTSIQADPVVELKEDKAPLEKVHEENKRADTLLPHLLPVPGPAKRTNKHKSCHHGTFIGATQVVNPQKLCNQRICWLGLPNPGHFCYMNSSLQSLLTLSEFVRDISSQEEVWSLSPQAQLIRSFMNIVRCCSSRNPNHKLRLLCMLKRAVSIEAPEFRDNSQKDAHEFLTTILEQMRSLHPLLQEVAASVGKTYSCPVKSNLEFKMLNTRTCKRCGAQSIREETFTSLSLNLLPGASTQQLLQEYQMLV